jgi:YggT family protein
MSWVMPTQSGSGLMRVLFDITEPVLAPVRRILPPVSGIDFSPILAIILIQIVNYVLLSTLNAA